MCQHRSMSRKYRNVRNKRISGVAARPRADCDDDTLLIYRRVSKCRLWLRRTIPNFYPCLRKGVFHAKFSDVPGLPMIQFPWKGNGCDAEFRKEHVG